MGSDQQEVPTRWTPVPDPTLLTTEALQREVSALKEILKNDSAALRELLDQKLAGHTELDDQKFANIKELFDANREAQTEATNKALDSIDKRFDGVNEFRGALNDLSTRMATKDQLDGLADKLETSSHALESRFEALYQRNRDDIDKITTRLNLREGEDQGSRLTKGSLYTIVGVAVGVIGLLVVLANYFTTAH